jgi:dihydrofolate reductase
MGASVRRDGIRAGLIDESALATYPVLAGVGMSFFTGLDNWMNLNLVETLGNAARSPLARLDGEASR